MNFDLVKYLKTNPSIALVGATNDTKKFGNIILRDLLNRGYNVIPINPRASTVEGINAYPDLKTANMHTKTDLIVYVVPPKITLQSLKEALSLNLKNVWIQPGAGDQNVQNFLTEENFNFLMNACVMVEAL